MSKGYKWRITHNKFLIRCDDAAILDSWSRMCVDVCSCVLWPSFIALSVYAIVMVGMKMMLEHAAVVPAAPCGSQPMRLLRFELKLVSRFRNSVTPTTTTMPWRIQRCTPDQVLMIRIQFILAHIRIEWVYSGDSMTIEVDGNWSWYYSLIFTRFSFDGFVPLQSLVVLWRTVAIQYTSLLTPRCWLNTGGQSTNTVYTK